jgi:hypothetical protein
VAETTVKRLLCYGSRRTGKAVGQVYQCWWRICREINVFFFQVRIRRGADKPLPFPIFLFAAQKIIFLGWVKEVRTTKP